MYETVIGILQPLTALGMSILGSKIDISSMHLHIGSGKLYLRFYMDNYLLQWRCWTDSISILIISLLCFLSSCLWSSLWRSFSWSFSLCWLLTKVLGCKSSNEVGSLTSSDHNLESLEVSQFFSLVESIHLLADSCLFPLGIKIEFLGGLGKSSGSASSQDWESKLGASKSWQWISNSWESTIWAIDEDSGVVKEINNND